MSPRTPSTPTPSTAPSPCAPWAASASTVLLSTSASLFASASRFVFPFGPKSHALLQDADPYVRKTAAVCVAKLYDINPELVHDQGFLDMLRDLLSDSNPMVVANAVAALSEIEENASTEVFRINAHNLQKLLAALNECTEWGQVRLSGIDSDAFDSPSI